MLKETGRQLMVCRVIQNSIGFWNKVSKLEGNHLIAQAMRENMTYTDNGWYRSFKSMLQKLCGHNVQLDFAGGLGGVDKGYVLSCTDTRILESDNHKYEHILAEVRNAEGSKVRACPNNVRDGFKAFKYKAWFQSDENMPIMSHVQDIADIRTLARFRCGTHWLATEVKRSNTARSDRVCPCCDSGEREDELHIFFCDAYNSIKASFPSLFNSESFLQLSNAYMNMSTDLDICMNKFMNKDDKAHVNDLVGFLRRSIKVRKDLTNIQ